MTTGHKHWTIAQRQIPPLGDATVSVLNASPVEAHVRIFIYYSNRDPVGPYHLTVREKRIKRISFNDFTDPEPIPRATDYASTIESDVPIVVQYPGRVAEEMTETVTHYET